MSPLARRLLLFGIVFLAGLLLLLVRRPNVDPGPLSADPRPPALPAEGSPLPASRPIAGDPPRPAPDTPLVRRSITLQNQAGQPLRGRIRAAISRDRFATFDLIDLETDDGGGNALSVPGDAWVVLDVRAPGHSGIMRAPVTWGELQDKPIEFSLVPVAARSGSSQSVTGSPLSTIRLQFVPEWPPGDFAGRIGTRMNIVDEELSTDSQGRFTCSSLRPGPYKVTFPDHPTWPAVRLSAAELQKKTFTLQVPWRVP